MQTILKAATLAAILFSANSAFATKQLQGNRIQNSQVGVGNVMIDADANDAKALQQNTGGNENLESELHETAVPKPRPSVRNTTR